VVVRAGRQAPLLLQVQQPLPLHPPLQQALPCLWEALAFSFRTRSTPTVLKLFLSFFFALAVVLFSISNKPNGASFICAMQRAQASLRPLSTSIARSGTLYIWGRISDGRLGMKLPEGAYNARDFARPGGPFVLPLPCPHLGNVVDVVCRGSKTLALTADGSVYSWGTCENLSLGHGDKVKELGLPRKLEALAGIRIVQIDAGETSSAALSDEGEVFTWGWGGSFFGGNGGLGHGNNITQPSPALVEALQAAGAQVTRIAVGNAHMAALDKQGTMWTWGKGEYGRCGNGKSSQPLPLPVDMLKDRGSPVTSIGAGGAHSLAVTQAGEVWGWGKNEASQLGLGAGLVADLHNMEEFPAHVEVEGGDAGLFNGRALAVAAGTAHSLAITRGGVLWQWGARTFLSPSKVPLAVLSPAARARTGAASAELPMNAERVRGRQASLLLFFFSPCFRTPLFTKPHNIHTK